jgi:hypothetical protein
MISIINCLLFSITVLVVSGYNPNWDYIQDLRTVIVTADIHRGLYHTA